MLRVNLKRAAENWIVQNARMPRLMQALHGSEGRSSRAWQGVHGTTMSDFAADRFRQLAGLRHADLLE